MLNSARGNNRKKRMKVTLTKGSGDGHPVSEMILGHNIEMCLGTANGLLSERLRNPKFLGPPHRMTGIAPHWMGTTYGGAAYELTPFGGLNGSEAQMVRVHGTPGGCHLVQNKVQVRAGEELELEIWARTWHEPVTVCAKLLPLPAGATEYDSGEVIIDKPYFNRYSLPLTPSRDDDEARLQFTIVGQGEIWFDQVHLRPKAEPHLCRGVMDTISGMRIPTLRFPGGIIVNAYHWKHGTGPVHLRPAALDAAFHHDWYLDYDFGLDEVLRLCTEQGIVPALTLNCATGTPAEASAMATYCAEWFKQRRLEPPLVYWHIANHPWVRTTAHMTPDMYADAVRDFAPGVKDAYPNSRIAAVIPTADLDAEAGKATWREALLDHAADLIDVVEVQTYGGCDPTAETEDQISKLATSLSDMERKLNSFIDLCRSRGVSWNVGLAEWNWWMQASHWDGREFEEPPTVLHGLFIAGMIRRFASLGPDLEVAHFYNLVNCMGIINHRGADVEVTDAVEVFNLYRPALPGHFVPLDVTVDTGQESQDVEALGLENDDGLYLFLTNRNPGESAQVSLSGLASAGASCTGLRGESPTGKFTRIERTPAGDTVEILPLSILRVAL